MRMLSDPVKIRNGVCNEVQYLSLAFFEILWKKPDVLV